MRFKDKYTTGSRAEPDRISISENAYAIGELLEQILNTLEATRIK